MRKSLQHFLLLTFIFSSTPLFAQQAEKIEYAREDTEESIQNIYEKVEELQEKMFSNIDSLSNKSTNLFQNAEDSLSNLSSSIQGKLQSKIDTLQQKLNQLKGKGDQQLDSASAKAAKIIARIDSLQIQISKKLQSDNLTQVRQLASQLSGNDLADKLKLPRLGGQAELNSKAVPLSAMYLKW